MKAWLAAIVMASIWLAPQWGRAQDDKADDGTDPTRLSTSFSPTYEALALPGGGDVQTVYLRYGTPISADARTSVNLELPLLSTSFGDSGLGVGDLSVKLTRVTTVTPTYGIVLKAEAVFDTADAPDRGAGVDVLKLTGIYAMFRPNGTIIAPSLEHGVSIGDPDVGRANINVTTFDLYIVPRLTTPGAYMTIDPAVIHDWEADRTSAALAVTYGQSVDMGLPGNESLFVKPSVGIGGHRLFDFGVEVGLKVIGF